MRESIATGSAREHGRSAGPDGAASFAPRNVEALVGMLTAWKGMQSSRAGARGARGPVVADWPA